MSERGRPALSVVLPAPRGLEGVRLTLRHLRRQDLAGAVEVVVVSGLPEPTPVDEELGPFWGWQWVGVASDLPTPGAYAAGVRRATAPVVVLGEDHSFPQPGWAEAILERHRAGWSVVGPAVINANPASAVSWADFVIGYGPWMAPCSGGPARFLPGHNSSYRREVLLGLGGSLEQALAAEAVLHADLARAGHGLYLEPEARTAHVNFSLLGSWLRVQLANGRVFAASRSRRWPWQRRLLFAAASPLVPAVRLARCVRQLARGGAGGRPVVGTLLLLAVGLVLDGVGQALGTLGGAGRASATLARFETDRLRHVTERDRAAVEGSP